MMRPLATAAALATLAALAACGRSPPSVTLTLDAVPPPRVRADYRGPPVVVPAVHVPAAIDRVELVRQTAPGEVTVDDYARWAAPMGTLARDALVRNLTARLPAGAVLPPGAGGGAGVRTIDVTILSLDAGPGGATMQAAFRILPNGRAAPVQLSRPGPATTPAATAQAFAALLGDLADRIAADLP